MTKRIHILALLAASCLLLPALAFGQTALTSTTTSAAIVHSYDTTIALTSTTGISASTTSTTNYLVIDREVMAIRLNGVPAAGTVLVTRGLSPGTQATGHVSGATVYYVPGATIYLDNKDRSGACSTTGVTNADQLQDGSYTPIINPMTGYYFSCVGGAWFKQSITVSSEITSCGTSSSCASPVAITTLPKIVIGHVAMASGTTVAVTGLAPTAGNFTSATSYSCAVSNADGHAYTSGAEVISATAVTLVSGTSNSDTWIYTCIGY